MHGQQNVKKKTLFLLLSDTFDIPVPNFIELFWDIRVASGVPRIFSGGGVQQIQLRTEDR